MKFEQALRAMRRGDVVRRRGCIGALEMREGKVYDYGQLDESPWRMDAILADDWVIVRKKKNLQPVPSEDELEPVGTMPVAGDVLVLISLGSSSSYYSGKGFDREQETLADSDFYGQPNLQTKNGRGPWTPDEIAGDPLKRILKRPLRNVFTDPRVGDVVQLMDCSPDTIHYVNDRMVASLDADGSANAWTRAEWAKHPPEDWKVISRQP